MNGEETQKYWKDLSRGDILGINSNQPLPADIILLTTSSKGQCYVETKNLDGETNLKKMEVSADLIKNFSSDIGQQ